MGNDQASPYYFYTPLTGEVVSVVRSFVVVGSRQGGRGAKARDKCYTGLAKQGLRAPEWILRVAIHASLACHSASQVRFHEVHRTAVRQLQVTTVPSGQRRSSVVYRCDNDSACAFDLLHSSSGRPSGSFTDGHSVSELVRRSSWTSLSYFSHGARIHVMSWTPSRRRSRRLGDGFLCVLFLFSLFFPCVRRTGGKETLGGLNRWFIPRGQDLAFLLSCIGLLGLRAVLI
jgi:hypothetical protein